MKLGRHFISLFFLLAALLGLPKPQAQALQAPFRVLRQTVQALIPTTEPSQTAYVAFLRDSENRVYACLFAGPGMHTRPICIVEHVLGLLTLEDYEMILRDVRAESSRIHSLAKADPRTTYTRFESGLLEGLTFMHSPYDDQLDRLWKINQLASKKIRAFRRTDLSNRSWASIGECIIKNIYGGNTRITYPALYKLDDEDPEHLKLFQLGEDSESFVQSVALHAISAGSSKILSTLAKLKPVPIAGINAAGIKSGGVVLNTRLPTYAMSLKERNILSYLIKISRSSKFKEHALAAGFTERQISLLPRRLLDSYRAARCWLVPTANHNTITVSRLYCGKGQAFHELGHTLDDIVRPGLFAAEKHLTYTQIFQAEYIASQVQLGSASWRAYATAHLAAIEAKTRLVSIAAILGGAAVIDGALDLIDELEVVNQE